MSQPKMETNHFWPLSTSKFDLAGRAGHVSVQGQNWRPYVRLTPGKQRLVGGCHQLVSACWDWGGRIVKPATSQHHYESCHKRSSRNHHIARLNMLPNLAQGLQRACTGRRHFFSSSLSQNQDRLRSTTSIKIVGSLSQVYICYKVKARVTYIPILQECHQSTNSYSDTHEFLLSDGWPSHIPFFDHPSHDALAQSVG